MGDLSSQRVSIPAASFYKHRVLLRTVRETHDAVTHGDVRFLVGKCTQSPVRNDRGALMVLHNRTKNSSHPKDLSPRMVISPLMIPGARKIAFHRIEGLMMVVRSLQHPSTSVAMTSVHATGPPRVDAGRVRLPFGVNPEASPPTAKPTRWRPCSPALRWKPNPPTTKTVRPWTGRLND